MKLFTELTEEVEYLEEAKSTGEKQHFIHGKFLVAEEKNRNGRIYPINILEKEVQRYMKELVESKRAFGELGHPSGPSINLDRVSHMITELKKDGNHFVGKALITKTPMGNIARGLLESGAKLGVSSRGMGSLKPGKDGAMVVQEDFRLATAADIVADPSAPGAFVEGIMENVEWIYDPIKGTWHEERLEEVKRRVHGMNAETREREAMRLFEDHLTALLLKTY